MEALAALVRTVTRLVNLCCPTCGTYYDPADPAASYPHNNH
ncbi:MULTISPECIES: hypothetical protein [unclassified Nocardiopsis]